MDTIEEGISQISSEIRDQIGDAAFPFTRQWRVKSPESLNLFKQEYPELYARLMFAIKQLDEVYCQTCND